MLNRHKHFLICMCQVENVTIQELQELTGKSKSVVYDWLCYFKTNCFPSYEALSKIICRLGITMDDFIKCKSDRLVDYDNYRTYKEYIVGNNAMNYYISDSIFDDPDHINILNCYLDDCINLKSMVNNYLKNMKIDMREFEELCKHLQPFVYSDTVFIDDLGDGIGYFLNSSNLEDYKSRTKLHAELCEDNPEYQKKNTHWLYLPNADFVLLKEAKENFEILKKYIANINKFEREILMENYLKLISENKKIDVNKRIFKLLYKNDCNLRSGIDEQLKMEYEQIVNELYK